MKSVPQLTTPSNKPPCRAVFSFLARRLRLIIRSDQDHLNHNGNAVIARTTIEKAAGLAFPSPKKYDDFKYHSTPIHMKTKIPHPIPYQGSKRNLAEKICTLLPDGINTLYEPFAGSAAITIYAAHHNMAKEFVIADSLPELIELWREIIENPTKTAQRYECIWSGNIDNSPSYFNEVRERFNSSRDPVDLLYLIVRCVKNAVRFNRNGAFTQSSDKRRLGTNPKKMSVSIHSVSSLLKGRTRVICGDFKKTIEDAGINDFVYMDPPYHGTTYGKDKRYFTQLERESLIDGISGLNAKSIPFLLSYDGMTGDTVYGEPLPDNLEMRRLLIDAGRSSQATLNGNHSTTFESLYVSKNITHRIEQEWSDSSTSIEKMFAAA